MYFCNRVLRTTLLLFASFATNLNNRNSSPVFAAAEDTVEATAAPDNRYIATFDSSKSRSSFLSEPGTASKIVGRIIPQIDAVVVEFDSIEEAHEWADSRTDVLSVEEDSMVSLIPPPVSKKPFTEKAKAHAQDEDYVPYGIDMVKASEIPDYDPESGIKMCIIDSGYDLGHIDLPGGAAVTGSSGFCKKTKDCPWDEDTLGHGTHVAGTMVALANDVGVVGVIPTGDMPLHIVRVFGGEDDHMGSWSDLIAAMYECEAHGANIINMSLGDPNRKFTFVKALKEITERNERLLIVASAGNDGYFVKKWPASHPGVMSVAALDWYKTRAYFSTYNKNVEIAAPGFDVVSTMPGNKWDYMSGTSMAAPHVAAVAARVWSHDPSMTAQEVRDLLKFTAEDLGPPGKDIEYGWGLVNALGAYESIGAPPTTPPPTANPTAAPTRSLSCEDSPTPFIWDGKEVMCGSVTEEMCENNRIGAHCPDTCKVCKVMSCRDSKMPFAFKGEKRRCRGMSKKSAEIIKELCNEPEIAQTCRTLCEYCAKEVSIDFNDEEGTTVQLYYRDDISFFNLLYLNGTMWDFFEGSGYDHGAVSPPNAGYNSNAWPIYMYCEGGSFSLRSVWLTPAWISGLEVALTGYDRDDNVIAEATFQLGETSDPTYFESELSAFERIATLKIASLSPGPSQMVIDNLHIAILDPCKVDKFPFRYPSWGAEFNKRLDKSDYVASMGIDPWM